jgi:clan AA aspartic protease (TIGR02281 family)
MGHGFIRIAGERRSSAHPKSAWQTAFGAPEFAVKWPQIATVASVLLLSVSLPARAGDVGNFLGGVVGGIIGQTMQPQQPPPTYQPPQYYQPQPQYQQPDPAAAEAKRQYLARQAELKRQKIQQEKDEAAARAQQAAAVGATSGPLDIAMKRKDGNLWVSAQINKVVTIDFVIDSGASDITLPRDVYLTLIRSGTLTKANYIGTANFGIADGSEVKGVKFKLASLQVGNQVLTDVVASVMPSDSATPLLGLSFLSRFQSWAIDNNSGTLRLTPLGGDPAAPAPAPAQLAAAAPQPLPDLTTIGPPAAQAPAPAAQVPALAVQAPAPAAQAPAPAAPVVMQGVPPELKVATAGVDTPRSGHVPSSALIVKDTSPPVTVAEAAPPPAAPSPKPDTAAAIPNFPANTPYATARSSLLALGYGPAPLPDAGKCDNNTDSTCFPERQACAKADNSVQCDFFWRRGEQVIKVKTVAVPPTVAAVECQVNCK